MLFFYNFLAHKAKELTFKLIYSFSFLCNGCLYSNGRCLTKGEDKVERFLHFM